MLSNFGITDFFTHSLWFVCTQLTDKSATGKQLWLFFCPYKSCGVILLLAELHRNVSILRAIPDIQKAAGDAFDPQFHFQMYACCEKLAVQEKPSHSPLNSVVINTSFCTKSAEAGE